MFHPLHLHNTYPPLNKSPTSATRPSAREDSGYAIPREDFETILLRGMKEMTLINMRALATGLREYLWCLNNIYVFSRFGLSFCVSCVREKGIVIHRNTYVVVYVKGRLVSLENWDLVVTLCVGFYVSFFFIFRFTILTPEISKNLLILLTWIWKQFCEDITSVSVNF